MVKIIKFLFFCSKSVFRYGGITSQIFRGLAALEPPKKWGAKWGQSGWGFVFFPFSIENEEENGKNMLYIWGRGVKGVHKGVKI